MRIKNELKILVLAGIIGITFVSCAQRPSSDEDGSSTETFTTLIVDKWESKVKNDESSEQWFKFTATVATQYIYVKFSTLTNLNVYLYDSSINLIGTRVHLYGSSGEVSDFSRSVSKGQTYYIKIAKGDYAYGRSNIGAYWIGFTDFPSRPEKGITNLNAIDVWVNGKIDSSTNGDTYEWFSFTATASTQYVYVKFSTLTNLNAYLYDSDLNLIGTKAHLYGSSGEVSDFSRSVSKGQTYYIKITKGDYAYGTSDTGKYWIGFTDFPSRPEKGITDLSTDVWVNGRIDTSTDGDTYEWFSFTATASMQYVYVKFSTLTNLNAYLYDSDLNLIGTKIHLYGSTNEVKSFSKSLNNSQTYYIKVTKGDYAYGTSDTGKYWITFNSTGTESAQ